MIVTIAIALRLFVFDTFIVIGDSMDPTLKTYDYVIVNKLSYIQKEPERGDVVVAKDPIQYTKIIKRIVGLPGEIIYINDGEVSITKIDGSNQKLLEEYIKKDSSTTSNIKKIKLDPKEYYLLGDNRESSYDSREIGPINKWEIRGKVIGILDIKTLKINKL